ncbi:hypothetical protein [Paenibacillus humicus]|nr:hypothetical protein [Paenibacillus humicus]
MDMKTLKLPVDFRWAGEMSRAATEALELLSQLQNKIEEIKTFKSGRKLD